MVGLELFVSEIHRSLIHCLWNIEMLPSLLKSIINIIDIFHKHAKNDEDPHKLNITELKKLLQQELEKALEDTNNFETIDDILQQLDQDGDKTVDFRKFILLLFGLTKTYYTCMKTLLYPELNDRERKPEIQEQAIVLEAKHLQKEKFQGRDQSQEFQAVQRDEMREQIQTPSGDECHGIRDQSLESQHIKRHQDRVLKSPEPQDSGSHQVREQVIPGDDKKYQVRKEELRYQGVDRNSMKDQIPTPQHNEKHQMKIWNTNSQDVQKDHMREYIPTPRDNENHQVINKNPDSWDVETHQVRDEITALRHDESHQIINHRLESHNVPQDEARCLNLELQNDERHQRGDLIQIWHDMSHQVRDHTVEPQDIGRNHLRDVPKSQSHEQHKRPNKDLSPVTWEILQKQIRSQISTPRNEDSLQVRNQEPILQDVQQHEVRNQITTTNDNVQQQIKDPSLASHESGSFYGRDQIPTQSNYKSFQARAQSPEFQLNARQQNREQIAMYTADEYHKERNKSSGQISSEMKIGEQIPSPRKNEIQKSGDQAIAATIFERQYQARDLNSQPKYSEEQNIREQKQESGDDRGKKMSAQSSLNDEERHPVRGINLDIQNGGKQNIQTQRPSPRENELLRVSDKIPVICENGKYKLRIQLSETENEEKYQMRDSSPEFRNDGKNQSKEENTSATEDEKCQMRDLISEVNYNEKYKVEKYNLESRNDRNQVRYLGPDNINNWINHVREQTLTPSEEEKCQLRYEAPASSYIGTSQVEEQRPAQEKHERFQYRYQWGNESSKLRDPNPDPSSNGVYLVRDLNTEPNNFREKQKREQQAELRNEERHQVREQRSSPRENENQERNVTPGLFNDGKQLDMKQISILPEYTKDQVRGNTLVPTHDRKYSLTEQEPALRKYKRIQHRDQIYVPMDDDISQMINLSLESRNAGRHQFREKRPETSNNERQRVRDQRQALEQYEIFPYRDHIPLSRKGERHHVREVSPQPRNDGRSQDKEQKPVVRQYETFQHRDQISEPRDDSKRQVRALSPEPKDDNKYIKEQRPEFMSDEGRQVKEHRLTLLESENYQMREKLSRPIDNEKYHVTEQILIPTEDKRYQVRHQAQRCDKRHQVRDMKQKLYDTENQVIGTTPSTYDIFQHSPQVPISRDYERRYQERDPSPESLHDERNQVRKLGPVLRQYERFQLRDQISEPRDDEKFQVREQSPELSYYEKLKLREQRQTSSEDERHQVRNQTPALRNVRRNQDRDSRPEFRNDVTTQIREQRSVSREYERFQKQDNILVSGDDGRYLERDLVSENWSDWRGQGRNQRSAPKQYERVQQRSQIPSSRDNEGYLVRNWSPKFGSYEEFQPKFRNEERQQVREQILTPREYEQSQEREQSSALMENERDQVRDLSRELNPDESRDKFREQRQRLPPKEWQALQSRDQTLPPRENVKYQVRELGPQTRNDGRKDQRPVPKQYETFQHRDKISEPRNDDRRQVRALSPEPTNDDRYYVREQIPEFRNNKRREVREYKSAQRQYERFQSRSQSPEPDDDTRCQHSGLSLQSRTDVSTEETGLGLDLKKYGEPQERNMRPKLSNDDEREISSRRDSSRRRSDYEAKEPLREVQDKRWFSKQKLSEPQGLDAQRSALSEKIGPITCEVFFIPKQKGNWLCYCLHNPPKMENKANRLTYPDLGVAEDYGSGGSYHYYPILDAEEYLYHGKEERCEDCVDDDNQQNKFNDIHKPGNKNKQSCGTLEETSSSDDEF
ncbi:trichohyalin-like [Suncus etruscus]|uniref:trichohyalin-like n=1 Tax=Suncus etruscus TaxID=109475 RepID=UPI00210FF733|nr:trichohyalin-like [Suncus etruscus]